MKKNKNICYNTKIEKNINFYFRHDDLGYATELDHYDLTIIDNGIWYKSLIGLGRHKEAFTLILAGVHGAEGAYDAGMYVTTWEGLENRVYYHFRKILE